MRSKVRDNSKRKQKKLLGPDHGPGGIATVGVLPSLGEERCLCTGGLSWRGGKGHEGEEEGNPDYKTNCLLRLAQDSLCCNNETFGFLYCVLI